MEIKKIFRVISANNLLHSIKNRGNKHRRNTFARNKTNPTLTSELTVLCVLLKKKTKSYSKKTVSWMTLTSFIHFNCMKNNFCFVRWVRAHHLCSLILTSHIETETVKRAASKQKKKQQKHRDAQRRDHWFQCTVYTTQHIAQASSSISTWMKFDDHAIRSFFHAVCYDVTKNLPCAMFVIVVVLFCCNDVILCEIQTQATYKHTHTHATFKQ